MSSSLRLVATCALGLEAILEGELRALGTAAVAAGKGAVRFRGGWREVIRANWRLRTANRVLVELGTWPAADGDALYRGTRALVRGGATWAGLGARQLFDPRRTLALRATSSGSRMKDVRWVALKTKDGLVDAQRERFGRRASVDRRAPDTPLRVWLHRDRATLLLDTSGEPLDRRGYRVASGGAPLREQLAAACVLAAEWDGRGPVVDPMCGTGTLLIEAAWIALGRAPGALRRGWAFERLPGYEPRALEAVRREPVPMPAGGGGEKRITLCGVDRSAEAIAAARANLEKAGASEPARLERGDAFDFEPPPGPGLLVVNPPYGERLAESPEQWKRLGDLLKQKYRGYRAAVIAGDAGLGKWIGLRPEKRLPVRNGPLEARILVFSLY